MDNFILKIIKEEDIKVKKRVIALLCMITMLSSMVMPVAASETTTDENAGYTEVARLEDAFGEEILTHKSARAVSDDYRQWEQANPEWADVPLGSSGETVGSAGCMVTSVTKLVIQAELKKASEINPGILAKWLNENAGFTEYGGLYWGKVSQYVSGLSDEIVLYEDVNKKDDNGNWVGVSSADYTDEIIEWIEEGYHMVLWVRSKGHWVAVDEGMTLANGEVYIMDSLPTAANNADIKLVDKYDTIYQVQAYKGGKTPDPSDENENVTSSKCGENLTWVLDDAGKLTISGTGKMYDFEEKSAPWSEDVEEIKEIVIENGVTSIGDNAFADCKNMADVDMADTVEWIGDNAFANCSSLVGIDLSSNLENIAPGLFKNCKSLEDVLIPGSVSAIDLGAFAGCEKVVSLSIPRYVETITKSAHNNSFETITVAEANKFFVAKDNVLFDIDLEKLYCYPSGKADEVYEVPATVTSLSEGAFYNAKLEEVELPEGLKEITDFAFYGAANLIKVEIPESVTELGESCFAKCTKLVSAELSESLTTIGAFAFVDCSRLTMVSIPKKVDLIGTYAFADCTDLNEIRFRGDLPTIGENAFQNVEATAFYPEGWEKVPAKDAYGAKKLVWTAYDYHIWDDGKVTKEPTCEETGILTISCSECDETKEEVIPATGHTYEWKVDKEPTETQEGIKHEECVDCGVKRNEDSEIPKVGHTHEMEKVAARPATCVDTGTKEYYTCATCGNAYSEEEALHRVERKDMVIATTAHKWNDGVVTRPTTELEGYTTYKCTYCGETKVGKLVDKLDPPVRVYGLTRYDTSIEIAKTYKAKMGLSEFDTVIIASGENFADALAGSYLAGVKEAPILMTNGKNIDMLKDFIEENLDEDGTVYILGGKIAVSEDVEKAMDDYTVKRIAGKDRYETNLAILKEAGVKNEDILVATGANFADSLSASAVKAPILLVDKTLTKAQKEFLSTVNSDFYILGGEIAVSGGIEKAIKEYGKVTRIGGTTRYDTSVAIAEAFFDEPYYAVLAYGMNFPDGLCGGPLAMAMKAPLILTETKSAAQAVAYADEYQIESGAVLGGSMLISDATAEKIFGNSLVKIEEEAETTEN